MPKEKISFEQFIKSVEENHQPFVRDLHDYLTANDCKILIEEKKSGLFASYKQGKPPKALANILFRKKGLLVRIYGENTAKNADFLNTLPAEMAQSIAASSECKRLAHNTCSPYCGGGYDFIMANERLQKCKCGCFEFLVTEESKPYIKSFAEHEIKGRK